MEAAKLTKRKTVNKSKLKKTIKNVMCRPDPVLWPVLPNEEAEKLSKILDMLKVEVPQFKKLHWNELNLIAKADRPKPPKLKKVEYLIFGISHCARTIPTGECKAIIFDAVIEPQILVHHIIEACKSAGIPFVCLKDLKMITLEFFGFKTCCLGIKNNDNMKNLIMNIEENSKKFEKPLKKKIEVELEMEITSETNSPAVNNDEIPKTAFTFLYRTSKESRVFVPPSNEPLNEDTNKNFRGQDFIDVATKSLDNNKNEYKKMVVKRIAQNPNRKRIK